MDVGEIIRDLRNKNNITQEELGAKLKPSVNRGAINKWENGSVENIKRSYIEQMSKIFHVSPAYIMGWEDEYPQNATSPEIDIQFEPSQKYNLYFNSAFAGSNAVEDYYYEKRYIEVPDVILGRYAGNKSVEFLEVNGESMNNVIPDSSYIGMDTGIELVNLKPGDIIVYRHRGDGISVKRYYDLGDEVLFKADSSDSAFKGKEYRFSKSDEDLEILGKVIMVSYRL